MGPVYAQLQVPVAEELRNIRERGRLAVLVTMGSSANRRPVLDVFHSASRTDVEIISPSAVCLSDADRETLPGNVRVTGWIPVHRLGDLVDVTTTHGGEGTVQTSFQRLALHRDPAAAGAALRCHALRCIRRRSPGEQ